MGRSSTKSRKWEILVNSLQGRVAWVKSLLLFRRLLDRPAPIEEQTYLCFNYSSVFCMCIYTYIYIYIIHLIYIYIHHVVLYIHPTTHGSYSTAT